MKICLAFGLAALLVQGQPTAQRTCAIDGRPSSALRNHDAMAALAAQAERGLKADLEQIDRQDTAALGRCYRSLFNAAMVQKHLAEARRYADLMRDVQETPAIRAVTGVITIPYMEATEDPGVDFRATFRARLSQRLAALPLDDVRVILVGLRDSLLNTSTTQLVDSVAASLDPAVKNGRLGQEEAEALVQAAMTLEILVPVRDDAVACLDKLLGSGAPVLAAGAGLGVPAVVGTPPSPLEGSYFGQTPPGETPVPFAPDILAALNPWVEGIWFSPDGVWCFISVGNASYSASSLHSSTRVHGRWTPFVQAPFTPSFVSAAGAMFSPDGRTLTFTGKKSTGTLDFWTVTRTGNAWGSPVALPAAINSDLNENPGTMALDGTMYFGRTDAGLHSRVFRAFTKGNGAPVAELLKPPINTSQYDGDPCIAPDGHFLVFYSVRADGRGGSDLYVSFSNGSGGWQTPVNLGPAFNSADDEYGAHLSADGRFLFYTRHTAAGNRIFWVAASAIDHYATAGNTRPAAPDATRRPPR